MGGPTLNSIDWFSLSSQVISDPECAGLQRSVCQGDAIAGIIPACLPLGFPSDKAVRQPYPCTPQQGLRAHTSGWRDSRKPSYTKVLEMR